MKKLQEMTAIYLIGAEKMNKQSGLRNNLTMLTDFYEITMANGYFTNGFKDTIVYFDMFFVRCLMVAVLPSWRVCSRWSSIWKI